MAEQWEMMMVSSSSVITINSKGYRNQVIYKYLREKGDNMRQDYTEKAISFILGDGWEPYGSLQSVYLFRRKYQG